MIIYVIDDMKTNNLFFDNEYIMKIEVITVY